MTHAPIIQLNGGQDLTGSTWPGFTEIAKDGYVKMADMLLPHIEGRWTRLMIKNPGGWHTIPGTNLKMLPQQWLLAKQKGARFADDSDLVTFHDKMKKAGVVEIILYVGGHQILVDPLAEGRENLAAFKAMGDLVSFGFDADTVIPDTNWAYAVTPFVRERTLEHYAELRSQGFKVYTESRWHIDHADWYQHVDGTIALAETDRVAQANRMPNALRFGPAGKEIIRMTNAGAAHDNLTLVRGWPDRAQVTPAMRDYVKFKASDLDDAPPPVVEPPIVVPPPVVVVPPPEPVPPAPVTITETNVLPFNVFTVPVAAANQDLSALTLSGAAVIQDWSGIAWNWETGGGQYNSCNGHMVLISDHWAVGGHCATTLLAGEKIHFRDKNGVDRAATITSKHMLTSRGIWVIQFAESVHSDVARLPIVTSSSRLVGRKAWGLETTGRIEAVTITSAGQSIIHDGSMSSGSSGFPGLVPLSDGRLGFLWPHYTAVGGPSAEYYLPEINAKLDLDGEAAATFNAGN